MAFSMVTLAVQYKWQLIAVVVLGYVASLCIYRRFFHPLARVPGPFLPAVTKLYQSYYNGQYYRKVEQLHERYGPIVRITPDEIHLSDADNYDKIYHVASKYAKSPKYYNALCIPKSSFGAITNEVHRIRRGALNPMFSRKMVLALESVVQDKTRKLCQRMQQSIDQGVPLDLHHAFRSVSVDVISEYAFNKSYDFLDKDDLGEYFFRMIRACGAVLWVFQQFPRLQAAALAMPPWLAPYLSEALGMVIGIQQECVAQVETVKARMMDAERYSKEEERPTIFSTLLSEDNKPDGYRVPPTIDMKDDAYSVLAAAADTTGNAMTVAAFHIMRNPAIYQELSRELETAFPDANAELPYLELERLPYLTGCIKEGLRLSFGVIGRLPRVVPSPGTTFDGYFVPAGTVVSMSCWMMHRNPAVFPEPMAFSPDRWLDPEDARRLDRHMVPFGRGNRICLGMPLAYCELYITLGTFFRRFGDLKVFKTTPDDMHYDDFFSAHQVPGNRWLKAYRPSSIT